MPRNPTAWTLVIPLLCLSSYAARAQDPGKGMYCTPEKQNIVAIQGSDIVLRIDSRLMSATAVERRAVLDSIFQDEPFLKRPDQLMSFQDSTVILAPLSDMGLGAGIEQVQLKLARHRFVTATGRGAVQEPGGMSLYSLDEIVARFLGEPSAADKAALYSAAGVEEIDGNSVRPGRVLLKLRAGATDVYEACRVLCESGRFRYAQPNFVGSSRAPLRPEVREEDGEDRCQLPEYTDQLAVTNHEGAWKKLGSKGDPATVVGILDDAVQWRHPCLVGKTLENEDESTRDFVSGGADPTGPPRDRHGTLVAGIAVSSCPGCSLLPIRMKDATSANKGLAVEAAAQYGADVIGCAWDAQPEVEPDLEDALLWIMSQEVSVVVAINDDRTDRCEENDPYRDLSSIPGVIAVGATDDNDKVLNYVGHGKCLDLFAPGHEIHTTARRNAYVTTWEGNSAAVPLAAGVIGLMVSACPTLKPSEIAKLLENSGSTSIGTMGPFAGVQRIDAEKAVAAAKAACGPIHDLADSEP